MWVDSPGQRAVARFVFMALVVLWPAAGGTAPPEDPFPSLDALEPNVTFWTRVFSEWSPSQVVFHDMEHPGIVYQVVDLPGKIEDRYTDAQKDYVEDLRENWQDYLLYLEERIAQRKPLEEIDKQWALYFANVAGGTALEDAHKRVRSQRGLRDRFREGIERSFRYDAEIRAIFRAAGLPEDLAYLPHVESSFVYRARSSAGATGLWQFTRGTGKHYMTITSAIDERLDPIAATHGAAAYLREAYDLLGSWPLALTSYNHGIHGMKRAKDRFGPDFERIYREYDGRSFGFASKNFYAEFLAARIVARDPERFFPEGLTPEPEFDLDHVILDGRTTPGRIAKRYGIPVGELADINLGWSSRAVRNGLALPSGTRVWLPKGTLARAGHADGSAFRGGSHGSIDAGHHVVRRGDTLSGIADAYGVGVRELREWNGIRRGSSLIHAGQTLRLGPEFDHGLHVVRRGETLSGIAARYGVSLSGLRAMNGLGSKQSMIRSGQTLNVPGGIDRTHVVRRGETLGRIASRYGIRLADLLDFNTLSLHSIIRPGQVLRIP